MCELSKGALCTDAITASNMKPLTMKTLHSKNVQKPFLYTLHFVSLIHSCLSTSMSNLHSIIFCQTFLFRSMLVRSPVDLQATGVVGTSARDIRADFEGPGCECWLVSDEYQRDLFSSFVRCESLSCAELSYFAIKATNHPPMNNGWYILRIVRSPSWWWDDHTPYTMFWPWQIRQ